MVNLNSAFIPLPEGTAQSARDALNTDHDDLQIKTDSVSAPQAGAWVLSILLMFTHLQCCEVQNGENCIFVKGRNKKEIHKHKKKDMYKTKTH